MQGMEKIETIEQTNPLLYLEYEGISVRAVIDKSSNVWLVLGDVCPIIGIPDQSNIIQKSSLKPFLSSAILDTPSGEYNLSLINMRGIEATFILFQCHAYNNFLAWAQETIPNIVRLGRVTPPSLDLDNMNLLKG